jgi:hypothetical protein
VRPKHIAVLIHLLHVSQCFELHLLKSFIGENRSGQYQSSIAAHSGTWNRGDLQAFRRICLDGQILYSNDLQYSGVYHISNNVERTRSTFTIEHGCDIRLREYYLDANRSHSSSGHGG